MKSLTITERRQAGKAIRERVPRRAHAAWECPADRPSTIDMLRASNEGRLAELVPLRYGRMLRNPFTFLRGSPALMARDLAGSPVTRVQVQACGDCHLLNFGLFASPERQLVFDINDFDETLQAPWEWDLKRLTASFVVAGRVNGLAEQRCTEAVRACVRSYREHLREFAEMSPLDIWYYSVTAEDLIALAPDERSRERREKIAAKARSRVAAHLFPKITEQEDGQHRFVEQPPVMTRIVDQQLWEQVTAGLRSYRESLPDDRRVLLDRYTLEDFALRVVGIGSVGTRCFVALLFCDDRSPLLLQIKEARPSVLEPYAGKGRFENQGRRVVVGQRLTQAVSDIFLGWLHGTDGHDYYVRQLRDKKYSLPVDTFNARQMEQYATACGWTLARAHATSGDAAILHGYLGRADTMDHAVAEFARAYADQVERDYEALVKAHRAGEIEAVIEAN